MGAQRDNKKPPAVPTTPDADDTADVIAEKIALEERGRAAGIEVDRRQSVADIIKQVEDAEADAIEPDEPAPAPAPAPKVVVKKAPYTVAPGVAISCLKGVIGEGEAITARDLNTDTAAGDKKLKEFVSKQKIIKN